MLQRIKDLFSIGAENYLPTSDPSDTFLNQTTSDGNYTSSNQQSFLDSSNSSFRKDDTNIDLNINNTQEFEDDDDDNIEFEKEDTIHDDLKATLHNFLGIENGCNRFESRCEDQETDTSTSSINELIEDLCEIGKKRSANKAITTKSLILKIMYILTQNKSIESDEECKLENNSRRKQFIESAKVVMKTLFNANTITSSDEDDETINEDIISVDTINRRYILVKEIAKQLQLEEFVLEETETVKTNWKKQCSPLFNNGVSVFPYHRASCKEDYENIQELYEVQMERWASQNIFAKYGICPLAVNIWQTLQLDNRSVGNKIRVDNNEEDDYIDPDDPREMQLHPKKTDIESGTTLQEKQYNFDSGNNDDISRKFDTTISNTTKNSVDSNSEIQFRRGKCQLKDSIVKIANFQECFFNSPFEYDSALTEEILTEQIHDMSYICQRIHFSINELLFRLLPGYANLYDKKKKYVENEKESTSSIILRFQDVLENSRCDKFKTFDHVPIELELDTSKMKLDKVELDVPLLDSIKSEDFKERLKSCSEYHIVYAKSNIISSSCNFSEEFEISFFNSFTQKNEQRCTAGNWIPMQPIEFLTSPYSRSCYDSSKNVHSSNSILSLERDEQKENNYNIAVGSNFGCFLPCLTPSKKNNATMITNELWALFLINKPLSFFRKFVLRGSFGNKINFDDTQQFNFYDTIPHDLEIVIRRSFSIILLFQTLLQSISLYKKDRPDVKNIVLNVIQTSTFQVIKIVKSDFETILAFVEPFLKPISLEKKCLQLRSTSGKTWQQILNDENDKQQNSPQCSIKSLKITLNLCMGVRIFESENTQQITQNSDEIITKTTSTTSFLTTTTSTVINNPPSGHTSITWRSNGKPQEQSQSNLTYETLSEDRMMNGTTHNRLPNPISAMHSVLTHAFASAKQQ